MKIAVKLLLLLLPSGLCAQVLPDYLGARATGKAGCSLFDDVYGSSPASVVSKPGKISLHHGFRYTPGLSQTSILGSTKFRGTGIAAYFSQFGYTYYRNIQSALMVARPLNEKCDLGIQLGWGQFNVGDRYYRNQHNLHSRLGIKLKMDKKIALAALVHFEQDLTGTNTYRERLWIKSGIQYKVSGQTGLELEWLQDFESRPILRLGLEYEYEKKWQFRTGISHQAEVGQIFIGTGFRHKKLKFDFASGWHPQLGFLPQTSLTYEGR